MPGTKTNKGQKQTQIRYYLRGEEYKPSSMVTRKMFGNGYKEIIGCRSVETGKTLLNVAGRPRPWHSVPFSNTRDKDGET